MKKNKKMIYIIISTLVIITSLIFFVISIFNRNDSLSRARSEYFNDEEFIMEKEYPKNFYIDGYFKEPMKYNDEIVLEIWNEKKEKHYDKAYSLSYCLDTNLDNSITTKDQSIRSLNFMIEDVTIEETDSIFITNRLAKIFDVNDGDIISLKFRNSTDTYSFKINKILKDSRHTNEIAIIFDDSIMKMTKKDNFFDNLYISDIHIILYTGFPLGTIIDNNEKVYDDFKNSFDSTVSPRFEQYLNMTHSANIFYYVMLVATCSLVVITTTGYILLFCKKNKIEEKNYIQN